MSRGLPYPLHIAECIRRVEVNTAEEREAFFDPHTLQDAVLRKLQTLSEATQRLSASAKAAHPKIPWREIAGFRNVIVHNYLGIDLEEVGRVVQRDVPELKRAVDALLREAGR